MAFFPTNDNGGILENIPNIFSTTNPIGGILTEEENKQLKNKSLMQGLLGTALTYLAQPKTENYGSAIPYLAKAYLGGAQSAQDVYTQAGKGLQTQADIAKFKAEQEAQSALLSDERVKNNPTLKALVLNKNFDKVAEYLAPKSTFGTGVEGGSLSLLARGSANTKDAEALRSTPEYALAYRNLTQDRTVMQESQDANGNITVVPVRIKAQPLPKSILPPTEAATASITTQTTTEQPTVEGQVQPTVQQKPVVKPAVVAQPQATQTQPPIVKKQAQTKQDIFKQEQDLRKQYQDTPEVKNFGEVRSAFNIINTSLSNASPAGDLAGATKFMKLLDPNSVVRDTELKMAMDATGVVDRAQNYFNMLSTGQKLNPTQRKDFKDVATKLYKAAEDVKNKYEIQYADIAKSNNLDPSKVIMGYKEPQATQNVAPTDRNAIFQKYGVKP